MKCEYVRLFINELADKQLTDAQRTPIEEHIAQCPQCKQQLNDIEATKRHLANLSFTDNISDQFIERAILIAEQQARFSHIKSARSSKMSYFAIAASFFVLISIGFMIYKPLDESTETVNILSQQQLNLLFDAPKALEQVTFTVSLPDNVEMQGFPGLKIVTWQGDIKQGKNLLSIPIIRNDTSQGIITTELQHHDTKRVFKINVQSDQTFKQLT